MISFFTLRHSIVYLFLDAVNNTENLWTLDPESGTVPISYVLDSRLDLETRENVERAVAEFNSNTCIR